MSRQARHFAEWTSVKGFIFTADRKWTSRITPYPEVAQSTDELFSIYEKENESILERLHLPTSIPIDPNKEFDVEDYRKLAHEILFKFLTDVISVLYVKDIKLVHGRIQHAVDNLRYSLDPKKPYVSFSEDAINEFSLYRAFVRYALYDSTSGEENLFWSVQPYGKANKEIFWIFKEGKHPLFR